jgi:hypothetical protein
VNNASSSILATGDSPGSRVRHGRCRPGRSKSRNIAAIDVNVGADLRNTDAVLSPIPI